MRKKQAVTNTTDSYFHCSFAARFLSDVMNGCGCRCVLFKIHVYDVGLLPHPSTSTAAPSSRVCDAKCDVAEPSDNSKGPRAVTTGASVGSLLLVVNRRFIRAGVLK